MESNPSASSSVVEDTNNKATIDETTSSTTEASTSSEEQIKANLSRRGVKRYHQDDLVSSDNPENVAMGTGILETWKSLNEKKDAEIKELRAKLEEKKQKLQQQQQIMAQQEQDLFDLKDQLQKVHPQKVKPWGLDLFKPPLATNNRLIADVLYSSAIVDPSKKEKVDEKNSQCRAEILQEETTDAPPAPRANEEKDKKDDDDQNIV